jgi:uncharacterized membrane protein
MMVMRSKWLAPVCIVVMLVVTAVLYNQLPAQLPVHWNINGQVDQTADRAIAAWLFPVMALAIWGLMRVLPLIDPHRESYKLFAGTYATLINLIVIFLTVLHVLILGTSVGWDIPVARLVIVGVGLLIAFLGNLMGRIQPNWFVGIRTPWTLSDSEVWKQTHRLGARTFFAAGLLGALFGLLLPLPWVAIPFFVVIFAGTLIPVVYSYVLWQRSHGIQDGNTHA